MILSEKVRLKPTKDQELLLWKSAGIARFIYNCTLNRQEQNDKADRKFLSDNDLRKEVTVMKKTDEFLWVSDVQQCSQTSG